MAARSLMAMSLAFHILFAVVGMALPLLCMVAEGLGLLRKDRVLLEVARHWAKATAVLFAVGAVSGTTLSFELGLLWPEFMRFAGPIIGMPFSLEGFFFFFEAIFLGIYLYGWDRVPPWAHWASGALVCLTGMGSGAIVVVANAWMNSPAGFRIVDGRAVDVDPIAAIRNASAFAQVQHMLIAAVIAVGFGVAGIHAKRLLSERDNPFHRAALGIALTIGTAGALLTPWSGHLAAHTVAELQPVKLAAMEAHWDTARGAPFRIGGWPDMTAETTSYSIEIPYLLSLLSYSDPNAEVRGLKEVPRQDRPPVPVVHFAFQIMIGAGTALVAVGGLAALLALVRRRLPDERWFLTLVVLASPLGFVAVEAGWVVTEVGRQPWIIHGVMRTSEAVTPVGGLVVELAVYALLYLGLGATVLVALRRLIGASPSASVAKGWRS